MNPQPLPLALLGNPVLREAAAPAADPSSQEIRQLVSSMLSTVTALNNTLGLAAPQVGVSLRVFIFSSRPSPRYPHAPSLAPTVVINPDILRTSVETESGWEGCDSIPGYKAMVCRPVSLVASWKSPEGGVDEMHLSGLPARVFLHEYDHLDGITILERLKDIRTDFVTRDEWLRILSEGEGDG
jgi:peptide deformylase